MEAVGERGQKMFAEPRPRGGKRKGREGGNGARLKRAQARVWSGWIRAGTGNEDMKMREANGWKVH